MNGIDKISAVGVTTPGDSQLSHNDSTTGLRNKAKLADVNSADNTSDSDNSSTKISLSSKSAEEIKKKHQLKQEEVKKTNYTLEMTGIPLYHGKLVAVVNYPNGDQEMIDVATGAKITAQDLQTHPTQSSSDVQKAQTTTMTNSAETSGETIKTHAVNEK